MVIVGESKNAKQNIIYNMTCKIKYCLDFSGRFQFYFTKYYKNINLNFCNK